jgi:hypothetical protein
LAARPPHAPRLTLVIAASAHQALCEIAAEYWLPPASRNGLFFLEDFKKLEYRHTQPICNYLNGVQRWICFSGFDSAQVGLIETAPFGEFDLA